MDSKKQLIYIASAAAGAAGVLASGLLVKHVYDNRMVTGSENVEVYHFDGQATGGRLIAKVLKNHGVKFIFTLIGGHISPILIGCDAEGIRVIDVRHEVTTVFAADAVSRLSGIPGVAAVTAGPGLTNTITAVKNAQMAQSPLILIGGATSDLLKGKGSLQDIDQFALMRPHVKWSAHVSRVADIVPAVRKAFFEAQSGTPGPVFLEFPIDTLYPQPVATGWYLKNASATTSLSGRIINAYMNYHLNKIFSVYQSDVLIPAPYKPNVVKSSKSAYLHTARLLKQAQRPVIVVGAQAMLIGGIGKDAITPEELQLAVQRLNIPVFTSNSARGLMGANHERLFRHCRSHALKTADLVILAGVVCDFRLGYGKSIGHSAKVVSINRDFGDLYKNRSPTYGYNADPATFLVKLAAEVDRFDPPQAWASWIESLAKLDIKRTVEISDKAQDDSQLLKPTGPNQPKNFLNPLRLLKTFDQHLGNKTVLVADGGDFVASAAYIVRPRGPLCWLDPGSFGTLGVAAGFALGAKLVKPDHDVWIIFGDGACGYSIPEYDTFVRHKIAIGAIVGNDACWMQILREQQESLHSDVACNLAYTDYDQVVQAFGGQGLHADTDEQFESAMIKAKEILAQQNTPVLINAIIAKSDFRKGSISV
ncbi:thiamine pyrophosphate-binding enzyme family protein [Cavenderia fasciculata]|uniref:Thiamine pyrophosphate-binding enzyme family protein n=1 Tax=Cavenderia fasciculata TaxID=261658 RepID=F4PGI6_CACFS|nr:thiamine pyrophosphate-binding enzyme family protein [Cavenderia fasciculata]EGG24820.1 thiamine pyrophosphate-binding enzyme family protein [Cavenderia fasciculata]|eukprot:XP_004362671.1 thiamine pyrophosphate-binding enzyme family protein [Cavenderia fasciculata]